MPRAIDGTKRKNRRKKLEAAAKGFQGRRKSVFRTAKDAVRMAGQNAFADRRKKKGDFRVLWVARISAACNANNITYSRFINGLKKANIVLNRKALSNMAIEDPKAFTAVVEIAKTKVA